MRLTMRVTMRIRMTSKRRLGAGFAREHEAAVGVGLAESVKSTQS
jgi:hypothetical protein